MNKEYIKLNDTDYIVANDNGNLNLIKSNNEINMKEILAKENELEELQTNSKEIHTNLILLKFNERKRKVITRFTNIIMGLFLLSSIFWANFLIPTIIASYCILEFFRIVMYGTKRKNNIEIKNAHRLHFEYNQKIVKTKNELDKLIKENEFKRYNQSIHTVITPITNLNNKANCKVKKLVLDKEQYN